MHRSQDLVLISTEQDTRLWANCARRGWRLKEPLDDQIPVERPRLLRRGFEILINEEVQTRANILDALPYSAKDIEDLTGLSKGFFQEKTEPVSLKQFLSERRQTLQDIQERPGQIVEFKPKDTKQA